MPAPGLLDEVIGRHADALLSLDGVIGCGEGLRDGRPCLVVLVDPGAGRIAGLPASIEGWPVIVERSGRLRADDPDGPAGKPA